MKRIEELTSIVEKIGAELASFQTGYLDDLAIEVSEFVYENEEENEDWDELLDAASTLGSQIEDTVACFGDSLTALKELEELLSKLK